MQGILFGSWWFCSFAPNMLQYTGIDRNTSPQNAEGTRASFAFMIMMIVMPSGDKSPMSASATRTSAARIRQGLQRSGHDVVR